jgi:hypothetical protein
MKMNATLQTRREFLRTSMLGAAATWTLPVFLEKTFFALDAMAADAATAGRFAGGGSNYGWYKGVLGLPFDLVMTVARYHEDPTTVHKQMQVMRDHGQRKITFFMPYGPDTRKNPQDWWGITINSSGGVMPAQQQSNLINLLSLCNSLGYEEAMFRIFAARTNSPRSWKAWNQAAFIENRNFTLSVRDLIVDHATIPVKFDPVGPIVNASQWKKYPWRRNYLIKMWEAYVNAYGAIDCIPAGFTTANTQKQTDALMSALKSKNLPLPSFYGIDLYADSVAKVRDNLIEMHHALTGYDQGHKSIIIMETDYNDAMTATGVIQAIEAGVPIETLYQWPTVRGHHRGPKTSGEKYFPDIYPFRFEHYLGI